MKLTLILAGPNSPSVNTQQVWSKECMKHHIELEVVYLENRNGRYLAKQLNLKSFPALVNKTKVIAVGHPEIHEAKDIIAGLT